MPASIASLERPQILSARTSKHREMNPALQVEAAIVRRSRAFQFLRLRTGGIELANSRDRLSRKVSRTMPGFIQIRGDRSNLQIVVGAVIVACRALATSL
jgi:hypothetical protein